MAVYNGWWWQLRMVKRLVSLLVPGWLQSSPALIRLREWQSNTGVYIPLAIIDAGLMSVTLRGWLGCAPRDTLWYYPGYLLVVSAYCCLIPTAADHLSSIGGFQAAGTNRVCLFFLFFIVCQQVWLDLRRPSIDWRKYRHYFWWLTLFRWEILLDRFRNQHLCFNLFHTSWLYPMGFW